MDLSENKALSMKKELLHRMESLLSEADRRELGRIHAPTVVAVPPMDTRCSICVMPNGEIRIYGVRDKRAFDDFSHPVYLASRDCGLSFKQYVPEGITASSGTPLSNGTYLSVVSAARTETGLPSAGLGAEKGLFAVISHGPDDRNFRVIPIDCVDANNMYLPTELSCGRILCPAQTVIDGVTHPVVLRSDDMGESWSRTILAACPRHECKWPHKGLRWQNHACEPTLTELSDGSIYLLARTSLDRFYEYVSRDGGESWTEPRESVFHGTLTSPQLLRLSDGRHLCFFNNTQPLPELDHTLQRPALYPGEIDGEDGEDVFTNRDANHAAISEDDGRTWKGFREIALNLIRNDADYRVKGVPFDSRDKSVHQFQAIELPMHRVLLSYGQNAIARRAVIFDVDWLYERSRREDFRCGLGNVSTQVYLKSVPGNFRVAGHCSWNRTNGAVLMPDPAENFEEAVFLSRLRDPRLFSETQGLVWNFPAAKRGEVRLRLAVAGGPLRLSLTDRWFNPVDETLPYYAELSFEIPKSMLPAAGYGTLTVGFDLERKTAEISVDETRLFSLPLRGEAENGLSYLVLQSPYFGEDLEGGYVKSLEMRAADEA